MHSLRNKIDELEIHAKFKQEVKDTCLLALTEAWLGESEADSDLIVTGFGSPFAWTAHREKSRRRHVFLRQSEVL